MKMMQLKLNKVSETISCLEFSANVAGSFRMLLYRNMNKLDDWILLFRNCSFRNPVDDLDTAFVLEK